MILNKIENRESRILKLLEKLSPIKIELKNDSQKHASHSQHLGDQAHSGETHYHLLIVSDQFNSLSRIERHRLVNECLKEEFKTGLHALEMKTISLDEYK